MNGSVGKQAEKVKTFTRQLGERIEIPIAFRDERLSTVMARRLLQTVKKTKKKTRQARDDAAAAALILQSYLDEVHS